MDKNSFFTGQPIFTQLLKFIPPTIISKLITQYQTDRYYKKFRTREHLVTMLYTCFHGCKSIREVITGMQVSFNKLNHLGMNCIPTLPFFSPVLLSLGSDEYSEKQFELLFLLFQILTFIPMVPCAWVDANRRNSRCGDHCGEAL